METLRGKYDATTRLLAAQCDTIERLRAELKSARAGAGDGAPSATASREGGKENLETRGARDGPRDGGVDEGREREHRRARKVIKTQVRAAEDRASRVVPPDPPRPEIPSSSRPRAPFRRPSPSRVPTRNRARRRRPLPRPPVVPER